MTTTGDSKRACFQPSHLRLKRNLCLKRSLTIFWFVSIVSIVESAISTEEIRALQDLNDATGGLSWAWREDEGRFGPRWNFSTHAFSGEYLHNPCSGDSGSGTQRSVWQGITCSHNSTVCATQTCHITILDLSRYKLAGPVPSSLNGLSKLERLALWENSLSGQLPPAVGTMVSLKYLDFYNNRLSGRLPAVLGNLTGLESLYLGVNQLTGPLAPELGNLASVRYLSLQNNHFTGPLPPVLGQLRKLSYLYANGNMLTGPLPPALGGASSLQYLSLYQNSLSGALPPELSLLTQLHTLYVSENALSGPLPRELEQLHRLKYVLLYVNLLTGPLLSGLGSLPQLQYLSLYDNSLTGSVPLELSQLTQLVYLAFNGNMLTGPLPPLLTELLRLEYVSLSDNAFTGSLPPELGALVNLDFLSLYGNLLTGTLPPAMGQLQELEELVLHRNHFESTLPAEWRNLRALRVLQLQGNLLTGPLQHVFAQQEGGAAIHLTNLENLDLSDNRFSGRLPFGVFALPSLTVLALSLNCFHGALPSAGLCAARNCSVMSLDGLGAARGCRRAVKVPLSGVTLFNTPGGSLPACVWSLPLLQVLHVTGNGLIGSIPSDVLVSSSLATVSLSHNKITGTIPRSVQSSSFVYLDLSHNKLTGGLHGRHLVNMSSSSASSRRFFLEVNRLSGHFPSSFSELKVTELSMLRGNLFGCGNIPEQDEFSEEYSCGSEQLDISLYLLLASLAALLAVLLLARALGRRAPQQVRGSRAAEMLLWVRDHKLYGRYLVAGPPALSLSSSLSLSSAMVKICSFGQELRLVTRLFVILLAVHLVASTPLYGVMIAEDGAEESSHSTHSHQYRWLLSVAYMRGPLSLVLLLGAWAPAVCALRLLTARDGPARRWFPWLESCTEDDVEDEGQEILEELKGGHREEAGGGRHEALSHRLIYVAVVLLDVSIVGCVNGVYVHFSSQSLGAPALVGLQLLLALFKLAWNMGVVPLLARPLRGLEHVVRAELLLRICNDILLPCIAAALTSPACFQGFLLDPDEVSSTYSYSFCYRRVVASSECVSYGTRTVDVAPLVPPFSYNNLCSSVVLTSYVPVFLLVYAVHIVLPAVHLAVFATVATPTRFPPAVRAVVLGVFWPDYWRSGAAAEGGGGDDQACATPMQLLKANRIMSSDVLNHLLVLFTFGLCSPFLAIAIVFAVGLKLQLWTLLLGRFVARREQARVGGGDLALLALSEACVPMREKLTHCVWPVLWTSALFFSCLAWDVLGDAMAWRDAVWAPVATLAVPAGLWLYDRMRTRQRAARARARARAGRRSGSEGGTKTISMERRFDARHCGLVGPPAGAPSGAADNPLHCRGEDKDAAATSSNLSREVVASQEATSN